METKKKSEEKTASGRKIASTLFILVVLIGLVFAARFLVSSVDIVGLLKSLHGG